MNHIHIMIAILVLLNVVAIAIYAYAVKCKSFKESHYDTYFYDENGNHIYYDRRLIAALEKEKQKQVEKQNH